MGGGSLLVEGVRVEAPFDEEGELVCIQSKIQLVPTDSFCTVKVSQLRADHVVRSYSLAEVD